MRAPLFSSGDRSNTVVVVSDDGAETVVGRVTTCPPTSRSSTRSCGCS